MGNSHNVKLPLTEDRARELKLGDVVYLYGEVIITSGLPTFRRILEFAGSGEPLPMDLNEAALLHLVCYNREENGRHEALYLNPTTSTRFNAYMPAIIRAFRLHVVGGKGGLDVQCAKAMRETGCVYLAFPGGASPILSSAIRECLSVGWMDLIAHYRLVRLRVEGLGPAVVAIDAHGNSIYENIRVGLEENFSKILDRLNRSRFNPANADPSPVAS